MEGWIKIHRKILDWEWYNDNNTKILFLHLLLTANHKDKKWKGQIIKRGQKITSIQHLAEEIRLTIQQVRTSLNKLKLTNEITIKSTSKYTLITIEKYSDYQDKDEENNIQNNTQDNKQITNEQQTNNKQITTNKNEKNIKNDKNERKEIVEIYNSLCTNLPQVQKITDKRKKAIDVLLKEFSKDQFENICKKANCSNFLIGKNERGWKADFDFITKIDKATAILEGKYETSKNKTDNKNTNYNNYEQRTYEDMDKFYANKF